MNSTPFDPYTKWLGIRDGPRPPGYYVLLGVNPNESDPAVIRRAADERTKTVRPRCLKYRELGTQLLNEIAKARVCLTDPERRAAYDESRKGKSSQAPEVAVIEPSKLAFRLKGDGGCRVTCLSFDPQGLLLAAAGRDGKTRIWNWRKGRLRATLNDSVHLRSRAYRHLRGGNAPLTQAVFSPDGAYFATAGEGTTAKLWDVTNGQLQKVLERKTHLREATDIITALAFLPNVPILAIGYKERAVELWNVNERKYLRNLACSTKDLAFSPSGLILATSRGFWDYEANKPPTPFSRDEGSANALVFSRDGDYLVTGTATGVHFWDTATGAHWATLDTARPVRSIALSPDGTILVAGRIDGIVEVWEVSERRLLLQLDAHTASVESIAFCPDNSVLATGGKDMRVKIWEMYAGTE